MTAPLLSILQNEKTLFLLNLVTTGRDSKMSFCKRQRESRDNQASGFVFVKKSCTILDIKFSRAYYLDMQDNLLFLPTYNWESQVCFAQLVFQTRKVIGVLSR